jgi:hypothetical protein
MLPAVRKVFATLDPTLGVATAWAKATRAELWIYAIDLHADSYWTTGFLQGRLAAWRDEAFRYASRVLAISDPMAEWLRSNGAKGKIDVVPPLYPVGQPAPLPEAPTTFLMSGNVYSINAGPLRWLQKAMKELAPAARLRLVTPSSRQELLRHGLDFSTWSIAPRDPKEIPAEVAGATWGVVGIDSGKSVEGERVAWPTKLREYLSLGRPVLCITRPEYGLAKLAANSRWGIVAFGEEETRAAVRRILAESRSELEDRARAAHAFARQHIDDATIGAAFRRELCA